jgi:uncharacterized membrane protein
MDWKSVTEGILRWIHVVAGVAWIGHLYFFNWVNAHFAATMDAETKKKVVPELMPRALYWFRWGAAFTWITGFLLAGLVYYMKSSLMWNNDVLPDAHWAAPSLVMVLVTWLGFLVYDQVFGRIKDQRVAFGVGLVLVAGVLSGMANWANWSFRGYTIHLAILFGTTMAFNVWFRIWPAQQKIITGIKTGVPADAALAPMAGLRSKHNTFMSVPLIYVMLGQHMPGGGGGLSEMQTIWSIPVMTLLGWGLVQHLYGISKKVKGF